MGRRTMSETSVQKTVLHNREESSDLIGWSGFLSPVCFSIWVVFEPPEARFLMVSSEHLVTPRRPFRWTSCGTARVRRLPQVLLLPPSGSTWSRPLFLWFWRCWPPCPGTLVSVPFPVWHSALTDCFIVSEHTHTQTYQTWKKCSKELVGVSRLVNRYELQSYSLFISRLMHSVIQNLEVKIYLV